jgi:nucleoside-diphosphate-sugar epimerase
MNGDASMTRILVTGGGGFIGSHLSRELFRKGDFVRVADVKFDDYIKEEICNEKTRLDLRVLENCLAATKGIDTVYNFAANMGGIGFISTVGAEVMHDNVLINANMLEASRLNKAKRYLSVARPAFIPPSVRRIRMSKV